MNREPIRYAVYIAALIAAAGTMLIDLSSGVALAAAAGKALLSLSVVVGGGEVARAQAWAPDTVNNIIDAETVITRDEGDSAGIIDDRP